MCLSNNIMQSTALKMSNGRPTFKLSLQVQKDGLNIKNSVQKITAPHTEDISIYQMTSLPSHLAPTVDRALSLPLQMYNLEIQNIISMAVIGNRNQDTKYITPLDPRVVINHFDPIFHTQDLTCCKYDDQTVITFSEIERNTAH